MEEENAKKEGVLLKCFVGLTILIVILGTAIVFTKLVMDGDIKFGDSQAAESENLLPMTTFEWENEEKLKTDPNYNIDDVVEIYEAELQKGDINHKFEVALSYANFVNDNIGDPARAAAILEPFGDALESESQIITYHTQLQKFYQLSGNEEKTNLHDRYLKEVMEKAMQNRTEVEQ